MVRRRLRGHRPDLVVNAGPRGLEAGSASSAPARNEGVLIEPLGRRDAIRWCGRIEGGGLSRDASCAGGRSLPRPPRCARRSIEHIDRTRTRPARPDRRSRRQPAQSAAPSGPSDCDRCQGFEDRLLGHWGRSWLLPPALSLLVNDQVSAHPGCDLTRSRAGTTSLTCVNAPDSCPTSQRTGDQPPRASTRSRASSTPPPVFDGAMRERWSQFPTGTNSARSPAPVARST